MNKQYPNIGFSVEAEKNSALPFLEKYKENIDKMEILLPACKGSCVRIKGLEMLVFPKILRTYSMNCSQTKFSLIFKNLNVTVLYPSYP